MDLGRVEVIKGVASALYGSGAMGGVVNLLSRRPGIEPEWEFLINRTSLRGTDGVAYLSAPIAKGWSASLLGSGHWQDEHDADGDQWADLAGYQRVVVRPRLFWDNGQGRSLFVTSGVTREDRRGGTVAGGQLPGTTDAFEERVNTRRYDLGGTAQTIAGGRLVLSARGAATWLRSDLQMGGDRGRDRQSTAFAEVAVRGAAGRHTLVAGAAFERDAFRMLNPAAPVGDHSYTHTVPGIFVQDDVTIARRISVLASGRVDWHSVYGTFFSPRVSGLFRNGGWTGRLSVGQGFFAPTPVTEETAAAGLRRLSIPEPLQAERGRGVSLDVTRTAGSAEYSLTIFASRVRSPTKVGREARYELINQGGPSTNVGVELLTTVRHEPFALTASYTYVRSREEESGVVRNTPLTPRHSAGLVWMIESEEKGRVGLEVYYTGRQSLEANPYATTSEPYVIVGALVERRLGRLRLFLNAENLTDVRQTTWHPLLRPAGPLADGRWTVDAWAPLEGRAINGGVRVTY
jgi:iron complex outermembrane receptor protein